MINIINTNHFTKIDRNRSKQPAFRRIKNGSPKTQYNFQTGLYREMMLVFQILEMMLVDNFLNLFLELPNVTQNAR